MHLGRPSCPLLLHALFGLKLLLVNIALFGIYLQYLSIAVSCLLCFIWVILLFCDSFEYLHTRWLAGSWDVRPTSEFCFSAQSAMYVLNRMSRDWFWLFLYHVSIFISRIHNDYLVGMRLYNVHSFLLHRIT